MRLLLKKPSRALKQQAGFTLVEILVSIALLGVIAATFMAAVGTSTKTVIIADKRDTAKQLAESEIEWVKQQVYSPSYSPPESSAEYTGYSVEIDCQDITGRTDGRIQKIVVIVKYHGIEVYRLEDYKCQ